MKKHYFEEIDNLIQVIETKILKNRCSLTEEDEAHLITSVELLKELKKSRSKKPVNWSLLVTIFELLLRVLVDFDFTDIFNPHP